VIVGAAAGAVALAPAIGSVRWRRTTAALVGRLHVQKTGQRAAFRAADLADVPGPARRYFVRSIPENQPLVTRAFVTQRGTFRTGAGDESWRPFDAEQHFSTTSPGLVWDARIRMAPLVTVRVRDAYVNGRGSMHASILGVYPVMSQSGTPALNAGALQRYLAEAVWFPTALLPASGVAWSPIDDCRARATLTDNATTVALEFRFSDAGDVREVYAPSRPREVDGRYEPTPWLVRCDRHDVREDMRIPTRCEVEWQLPAGPLPYWRGDVTHIRYQSE